MLLKRSNRLRSSPESLLSRGPSTGDSGRKKMGVMDTKKNEKSTPLIKAVEALLSMINTQITTTQSKINQLRL
jgi:hypothetical protein